MKISGNRISIFNDKIEKINSSDCPSNYRQTKQYNEKCFKYFFNKILIYFVLYHGILMYINNATLIKTQPMIVHYD